MISNRRRAICIAAISSVGARAQTVEPGVSSDRIVFGQTIGYDSVWGSLYKNYSNGLLAYFKHVNSQGGVHGRKIELLRKEDNYNTEKAVSNIRSFGIGNDVFGLVCIGGTGITLAALPLLAQYQLPTVGALTGADGAREYNKYLFHTRTGYSNEIAKMVEHLTTIGISRISAVYQENAFGKSCFAAAEKSAKFYKAQIVASVAHPVDKWDAPGIADALERAGPQAVLMFTSPATVAGLIKSYKARNKLSLPSPWVLSVTSVPQLYELLQNEMRGIAMTQVMPNPHSGSSRAARHFREIMQKQGLEDSLTYEAVEGFMTGRVVVEALRQAGRNLTRAAYIKALEGFEDIRFEELSYRYTSNSHLGPSFVDVTILGENGAIVR
jgi:branched-chain amino acid transport system substrate-binding protein